MATISSLGIGSGLDLSGLLDQLKDAENQKLEPIVSQQKSYQTKLSAFGTLESSLTALRDSLKTLSDPETFRAVKSSITGDAVSVSSTGQAVAGRYQVEVEQLAQSQSVVSGRYDSDEALPTGTLTYSVGETSFDVEVSEGDTLADLRDAINAEKGGINASLVNDGTGTRLVLTSSETGTDAVMTVQGQGELGSQFGFGTFSGEQDASSGNKIMVQTVPAANAKLEVNGIAITSQSNTVEEALQGVTLNLTAVTDGAETLTVAKDNEGMAKAVTAFVNAYNGFQTTADALASYNSESDTAGALLGNSTMRSVESRLRGALGYGGGEGDYRMLSDLGIERQLDGKLKVDEDKLEAAIATDSDAVSQFFSGPDGKSGFAKSVDDTMGTILDDGGLLDIATDGIDQSLERLGDRYSRTQESINATIERYRTQFAQLDQLVSQMNSTSTYLTQQFDALSAQLNQN